MLNNVIATTELCRHSLMCRHVCPVGNLTRSETLTPHGWAQLVAMEQRGLSTWNAETVDALYQCADCGNCRTHCVSSQPLPEAIAAVRAGLAKDHQAPRVVYEVGKLLQEWRNPYLPKVPEPVVETGECALFVGDAAFHLRPTAWQAACRLLEAAGVEAVSIAKGRNTGYMASALGLTDVARSLAQETLAELRSSGASRIYAIAPEHHFALGQLFDERLGCPLPEGIRIVGLLRFLHHCLDQGTLKLRPKGPSISYAYIDPTHAVRSGAFDAPRKLLCAVLGPPAGELFWRRERAYPCGNLALEYTHPQLADSLTRARLEDAKRTGCQVVVTEDPGCLIHLDRLAPEFGLEVRGLYETIADYLPE